MADTANYIAPNGGAGRDIYEDDEDVGRRPLYGRHDFNGATS